MCVNSYFLEKVDFVKGQNFLAGSFGHKRSITSKEITHLFVCVQTNAIGKTFVTGFAQVAQNKEVNGTLLIRGRNKSFPLNCSSMFIQKVAKYFVKRILCL